MPPEYVSKVFISA